MFSFLLSRRRRHTKCALGTGVQTCALPISTQLINPTQWQEARTRLSDEIAALEKEMADSAVGQMFIPGIGMSNPIDLSPMFASAHNGLEEMARQFQESGEKSSKAMVDMVNNSLHALNE